MKKLLKRASVKGAAKKNKYSSTHKQSWGRRIFRWIRNILLFILLFPLVQVVVLKWFPVYVTPLMAIRLVEQATEGKQLKCGHYWQPLDRISPSLVQAVVASEDNLFMEHYGFDFEQIREAKTAAKAGKRLRGASTISQQTAKNVFLWPKRSYFRKGIEAYYTLLIELIWSKRRIMEVYLNSIETGNGIYGAEAVAQAHFRKTAAELSASESALIAATLPNPLRFNSARPSDYVLRRRDQILSLMGKIGQVDLDKKPENQSKPGKDKNGANSR